jgi:hypothetical protein
MPGRLKPGPGNRNQAGRMDALRAGRVSTDKPAWWLGSSVSNSTSAGYAAYVWLLDRTVMYVLTREHGGGTFCVRTILSGTDEQAA